MIDAETIDRLAHDQCKESLERVAEWTRTAQRHLENGFSYFVQDDLDRLESWLKMAKKYANRLPPK